MSLPKVDKFKVGDRVRVVISGKATGASGVIVKVGSRDNGFKVYLDDAYLADKPAFFHREIWVRPLNLRKDF